MVAGAAEVDAGGARLMQSLDAKQAQDTAAIQQAASAVAQDAALVQGMPRACAAGWHWMPAQGSVQIAAVQSVGG